MIQNIQKHYVACLALCCLVLGLTAACNSQQRAQQVSADEDYLITISTSMGDMHAILYDQTPQHKTNFVKLVQEGYYKDLLFHRVIPQFMIQGGDPKSKTAGPDEFLGNTGPGYYIPAEIVPGLLHDKGALAAARKPDQVNPQKESDGGQFYIVQGKTYTEAELREMRTDMYKLYDLFQRYVQQPAQKNLLERYMSLQQRMDNEGLQQLIITQKDSIQKAFGVELEKPLTEMEIAAYTTRGGTPFLDGEYSIFGHLVDGYEVLDKIAAVQTGAANRPAQDVRFSVSFEILKKSEISRRFGYQYASEQK